MKKTPTVFERDWDGDRSRVLPQVHPGCEWVLAGDGVPTRKLDGTCCMVRKRQLFRRQEIKEDQTVPEDFEEVDFDAETDKRVGWRPVGEGPEDRWHREAFEDLQNKADGTYELIGPKIQGNPEKVTGHLLIAHTIECLGIAEEVPRDFEGLKAYLATQDIEGIVFHHPDGRMAKVKKRDFGLRRTS